MMNAKKKEGRKIRELVRIGIFSALWIVCSWLIACTIGFFPPIMLLLPCILGLVGAIILVVMLSKVHTAGGILIPSALMGITLFSNAPYGLMFIFTFCGGIIGEIIYQTLGKRKPIGKVLGIIFPMIGLALGEYIPLAYLQKAYLAFYEGNSLGMGAIAQASMDIINTPIMIILVSMTIVLTWIGYVWGNKLLQKRLAS